MDAVKIRKDLMGKLIGLARATEGNEHKVNDATAALVVEVLLAAFLREILDHEVADLIARIEAEKQRLVPECYKCASPCGRNNNFDMNALWNAEEEVKDLKYQILFGIHEIAVKANQAPGLGRESDVVHMFLYKALFAIGAEDWGTEELLPIRIEMRKMNQNI